MPCSFAWHLFLYPLHSNLTWQNAVLVWKDNHFHRIGQQRKRTPGFPPDVQPLNPRQKWNIVISGRLYNTITSESAKVPKCQSAKVSKMPRGIISFNQHQRRPCRACWWLTACAGQWRADTLRSSWCSHDQAAKTPSLYPPRHWADWLRNYGGLCDRWDLVKFPRKTIYTWMKVKSKDSLISNTYL